VDFFRWRQECLPEIMIWEGDILVEYIVEYLPGQALLKTSKVTDMVCLRWTGWNAVLVNSDRNDGME